jgi:hypothetical protein
MKRVREMTDEEVIVAARDEKFGEAMNESLAEFFNCEAYENRMGGEEACSRKRAFLLGHRLVHILLMKRSGCS